jgi:predicted O-methyltransferase YrrM
MATLKARVSDALVAGITRYPGVADGVVRRAGSPRIDQLSTAADSWTLDPADMVVASFGVDRATAQAHLDDARVALADIRTRGSDAERVYPTSYEVEEATATFLHAAVRITRPESVLETGVADGLSSALMLSAMEANGCGALHSIDIASDVGVLVTDRDRWNLHIVDADRPEACADVIRSLRRLDLFLHDGNHTYAYQRCEYEAAWTKLAPGGYLVSDDVDYSYAFLEFLEARGLTARMLLDRRKVFGLVRKP